jgi:hypothetical protein
MYRFDQIAGPLPTILGWNASVDADRHKHVSFVGQPLELVSVHVWPADIVGERGQ